MCRDCRVLWLASTGEVSQLLPELPDVAEYYFFWAGSTCLTRRLRILATVTHELHVALRSGVPDILNG